MREIKFRAWDKIKKEYIFNGLDHAIRFLEIKFPGKDDDILHPLGFATSPEERERFDYEQFTGLRDINGKEIYEGDILIIGKHFDIEDDDDGPSWIDESIHRVAWMGDSDYPAFDLDPSIDTDCNGLAYVAVGEQDCEIIGNIHENPELLEATK